ncbi:MAG TPA: hypothetical protein IGR64_00370 [Leptolyngbyaceae cyanobacterium M65_K2018_010]|nr:hypothetical protein [Leptolyngbyaceae cyanobacterium M65_K2018_010]
MDRTEALRWTVIARIEVAGRLAAIAQPVGVFIDLQTGRPVPLPAQMRP